MTIKSVGRNHKHVIYSRHGVYVCTRARLNLQWSLYETCARYQIKKYMISEHDTMMAHSWYEISTVYNTVHCVIFPWL